MQDLTFLDQGGETNQELANAIPAFGQEDCHEFNASLDYMQQAPSQLGLHGREVWTEHTKEHDELSKIPTSKCYSENQILKMKGKDQGH